MTLLEELEIAGIPWEWLPPGDAVTAKPLYASEQVFLLSGASVNFRGALGGWEFNISPGDTYVVPLATKLLLEAACAAGTPVHLLETYSNPQVRSVWPACTLTRAEFREVSGSERTLYTYALTLTTGV